MATNGNDIIIPTTAGGIVAAMDGDDTVIYDVAQALWTNAIIIGGRGTDRLVLRHETNQQNPVFDLTLASLLGEFEQLEIRRAVTTNVGTITVRVSETQYNQNFGFNSGVITAPSAHPAVFEIIMGTSSTLLDLSNAVFQGPLTPVVRGDGDAEWLIGAGTGELFYGGGGGDRIEANAGNDTIFGGLGNDSLTAGTGNDTVHGDGGADILVLGGTADVVYGGTENDLIITERATASSAGAVYDGGAGDDVLLIATLSNNTVANLRNDVVRGVETIRIGSTLFTVVDLTAPQIQQATVIDLLSSPLVRIHMDTSTDFNLSALNRTGPGATAARFEILGDTDVETITGSAQNDVIFGGGNGDQLFGGGGDDTLTQEIIGFAGTGAVFSGGLGTDRLILRHETAQMNPVMDLTAATISGIELLEFQRTAPASAGVITARMTAAQVLAPTTLIGPGSQSVLIEVAMGNLTLLNLANVSIIANVSFSITGDAKAETIVGSSQSDTIEGGGGGDTLSGSLFSDILSYRGSPSGVFVDLERSMATGSDATGDVISGFSQVIGSAHGDTLIGLNAGDGTIYGGDGDDTLSAFGTANGVYGGLGDDIVSVSAFRDNDDVFDGGGNGTIGDTLSLSGLVDLRQVQVRNFETLTLRDAPGGTEVRMTASEADPFTTFTGQNTLGFNRVTIDMDRPVLDLSGVSISGFASAGSGFRISGSRTLAVDETITGTSISDVIDGGAGNDTLIGGPGVDSLFGDASNDVLIEDIIGFVGTNAVLDGGPGRDRLMLRHDGPERRPVIDLTQATLRGIETIDVQRDFRGGAVDGITVKLTDIQLATIEGFNAAAGLLVTIEVDRTGTDTARVLDLSNVNISQGESFVVNGRPVLDVITGSSVSDIIYGNADRDFIVGGDGNDSIYGGAGNDFMYGGDGDDLFDGGADFDYLRYERVRSAITIDLSDQSRNAGAAQGDVIRNVEYIEGSPFNDTITGDAQANSLSGYTGADTIEGGGGADSLDGSVDRDTLSYASSPAGVTVNLRAQTVMGGDATGDTINNFENVLGSAHNDNLRGDTIGNTISGGDGNDLIQMQDGGSDHAYGGVGNDGIYFGARFDRNDVVDGGPGTLDQLALQGDYSSGVSFGANAIRNIEQIALLPGNITALGAPGNEFYSYNLTLADTNIQAGQILQFQANGLRPGENFTLNASAERDGGVLVFGAGAGTNNLTGGQANDGFFFGANLFGADDRVDGQGQSANGLDSLGIQGDYSAGYTFGANQMVGIELLALFTSTFSGGPGAGFSYNLTMVDGNVAAGETLIVQANQLAANETLIFNGAAEADGSFRIFSGDGNDTIQGSAGADTIAGGGGGDTLSGQGGNDIFLFASLSDSAATAPRKDSILDFALGDQIGLSVIDAIAGTATNDAFTLIGSAAFSGTAGELQVRDNSAGQSIVLADVDGNRVADFELSVTTLNGHQLSAADFLL